MSTGPFDPNSGYGVYTHQDMSNNPWVNVNDPTWIRNRLAEEKKEHVSVAHQLRRILQESIEARDYYTREILDGVDTLFRSEQTGLNKEEAAKRLFKIIAPHLDHAALSNYLLGNTDADLSDGE
ncbi:hypothetical protein [Alteromonas mediterranea]|uniref:hypothetical protein n=1 Tax=Alteromonas mediterranea TaxID=314275 RepID=UPI00300B000B